MKKAYSIVVTLLTAGVLIGYAANTRTPASGTLKDAFRHSFLVGAALNEQQFTGASETQVQLVADQFNSITPENVMKWEVIHPAPDQYNFDPSDQFVAFGEKREMFIVGHTLIWHEQTPKWVFEEDGKPASREVLLKRMHEHIQTVVGRYKGRVNGWDVVNEALKEDGSLRQTPWLTIIGEDYLEKAFTFAHEVDPTAELYYNDYSLENAPKREGAVVLVRKLQDAGVKIHGIGIQSHGRMDWPTTAQVDETLTTFANLGLRTMITELDIDVLPTQWTNHSADVSLRLTADPALNPYTNGLPAEVDQALAKRYADLFAVYLKHQDNLQRVTFWGVSDGDSWLNNWPIRGRTSYPLLFDRDGSPKLAYLNVVETVTGE